MNKYILATFIVLLAAQGLDAQFLGYIFQVTNAVTGFVFGVALSIPRILIAFSYAFAVAISNVVFTTIAGINLTAYNALTTISNTATNVNSIIDGYLGLISTYTGTTRFLGQVAIGNLHDIITGVSYTAGAIASIIVGCMPPQAPLLSIANTQYPAFAACLSSSTTNCGSTTISCQASSFIALNVYHLRNINLSVQYLNTLAINFPNNAAITNLITQANALISLWTNLNASASAFVSISTTGLLMAQANFSANIINALTATASFLAEYRRVTEAILNNFTTNLQMTNVKLVQNFVNWIPIYNTRLRRRSMNEAFVATSNFAASVRSSLSSISSIASTYSASIKTIATTSYIYANAISNSIGFDNLAKKLNVALDSLASFIVSRSTNVEERKLNVITSVTTTVYTRATTLLQKILNGNNANCQSSSSSAVAQAMTSFSFSLQSCGQVSDTQTQKAISDSTDVYKNIMVTVSSIMNATHDCYSNGCATALIYKFAYYGVACGNDLSMGSFCGSFNYPYFVACPSNYANYINNCLGNTLTNMNALITSIDSTLNNANNMLTSAMDNAISELNSCSNTQVSVALNALASVDTTYTTCTATNP